MEIDGILSASLGLEGGLSRGQCGTQSRKSFATRHGRNVTSGEQKIKIKAFVVLFRLGEINMSGIHLETEDVFQGDGNSNI